MAFPPTTSWWGRVWVPCLLVVVMVLFLLPIAVWSKPGEYFTVSFLQNKRLPKLLDTTNTGNKDECQKQCEISPTCNAFAVSEFEANCILYNNDRSSKPVKYNTYTLYVLRLKEEDGYYVHGTDYYKVFPRRLPAPLAAEYCKKNESGMLATVKSKAVNQLLWNRMTQHNMWTAFIGVSDSEKEEEWRYADGKPVGYTNWAPGGQWPSERRDCALLTINAQWVHADCWHKDFFICQIPMF